MSDPALAASDSERDDLFQLDPERDDQDLEALGHRMAAAIEAGSDIGELQLHGQFTSVHAVTLQDYVNTVLRQGFTYIIINVLGVKRLVSIALRSLLQVVIHQRKLGRPTVIVVDPDSEIGRTLAMLEHTDVDTCPRARSVAEAKRILAEHAAAQA